MHAGWFANEPPQMSPPGPNPGLVKPCKQGSSLLCSETARAFQGAGSPEKRRRPRRCGAICYITQRFRIYVRPPTDQINRAGFPGCGRCCVFFDILVKNERAACDGAPAEVGPICPNGLCLAHPSENLGPIVCPSAYPHLRLPRPCGGDPATARPRGEKTGQPKRKKTPVRQRRGATGDGETGSDAANKNVRQIARSATATTPHNPAPADAAAPRLPRYRKTALPRDPRRYCQYYRR